MSETTKIHPKLFNYAIEAKSSLNFKEINNIIDKLMRSYSILKEKDFLITLYHKQLHKLSNDLKISLEAIELITNKFLIDLAHFRKFMKYCEIRVGSMDKYKKTRIYLHKIHRIAPIFDYRRARINLKMLYRLFYLKNFWPTLTTQLAILIYITDSLDCQCTKKLLQKNIRLICSCSAYAYHRTKNRLEIKRLIEKDTKLKKIN